MNILSYAITKWRLTRRMAAAERQPHKESLYPYLSAFKDMMTLARGDAALTGDAVSTANNWLRASLKDDVTAAGRAGFYEMFMKAEAASHDNDALARDVFETLQTLVRSKADTWLKQKILVEFLSHPVTLPLTEQRRQDLAETCVDTLPAVYEDALQQLDKDARKNLGDWSFRRHDPGLYDGRELTFYVRDVITLTEAQPDLRAKILDISLEYLPKLIAAEARKHPDYADSNMAVTHLIQKLVKTYGDPEVLERCGIYREVAVSRANPDSRRQAFFVAQAGKELPLVNVGCYKGEFGDFRDRAYYRYLDWESAGFHHYDRLIHMVETGTLADAMAKAPSLKDVFKAKAVPDQVAKEQPVEAPKYARWPALSVGYVKKTNG